MRPVSEPAVVAQGLWITGERAGGLSEEGCAQNGGQGGGGGLQR